MTTKTKKPAAKTTPIPKSATERAARIVTERMTLAKKIVDDASANYNCNSYEAADIIKVAEMIKDAETWA